MQKYLTNMEYDDTEHDHQQVDGYVTKAIHFIKGKYEESNKNKTKQIISMHWMLRMNFKEVPTGLSNDRNLQEASIFEKAKALIFIVSLSKCNHH